MDLDTIPKCYGTNEYYKTSRICERCLHYIDCGLVENKVVRKINREIRNRREEDDI